MKLGIIGLGRLGKLLTRYLAQDADVLVFDPKFSAMELSTEASKLGATAASFEETCACPIVIPCVPIGHFEEVIQQMVPHLKAGTLVADVCSVKELPSEIMQKHLGPDIYLLATHPMFGPDSARHTVFGRKIVLYNLRTPEKLYQNIKGYLEGHGLKIVEATPTEHDKQIAKTLVLTHFIGRTLIDFKASPQSIDTKGHRRLIKILDQVENDSIELFLDMNKYNRFAKSVREDFMSSMGRIDQLLS